MGFQDMAQIDPGSLNIALRNPAPRPSGRAESAGKFAPSEFDSKARLQRASGVYTEHK